MGKPALRLPSSFRDPSGYLFRWKGKLYRRVEAGYLPDYRQLMDSGLYAALTKKGWLVPHEEVKLPQAEEAKGAALILRPEELAFISYPYEWSFNQLKDAALRTLAVQRLALEHGMSLKDASAYNMQFRRGRPVLIDTLSFERYVSGQPWVAYRQFCQHFLAPLALVAYTDLRLNKLLQTYIDGVPLDLASALLPTRTRLRFFTLSHLHWHAKSQQKLGGQQINAQAYKMSPVALTALLANLQDGIRSLRPKGVKTEWGEYYDQTNYTSKAFTAKEKIIAGMLKQLAPKVVWDLGANTGVFSRVAARYAQLTVAFDIDPLAVDRHYLFLKKEKPEGGEILPLLQDLTAPSPAIGWAHTERMSFAERGPADTILALALIHHLAIGNNLPFPVIARFFRQIGGTLIIEFVPKNDSQVERLLRSRTDIFPWYEQKVFEKEFSEYFEIISKKPVPESKRVIYLMKARP